MEFQDVITMRRSIRNFKQEPVPDGMIMELLEAARLAPSGLNVQPWRFVVVKDATAKKQLVEAGASAFLANAPAVILCCADMTAFSMVGARVQELVQTGAMTPESIRWLNEPRPAASDADQQWILAGMKENIAIAITHILLKATDLGLGSCWLGAFDEDKVKAIAGLDGRYGVTALLAIGFADQAPDPRPRIPVEDLLLKTV